MNDGNGSLSGKTAAVLLTAGRSSRFGPSPKALALLGGMTLLARTLDAPGRSAVNEIIVVVSDDAVASEAQACAEKNPKPVRIVKVGTVEPAMSASLKAGIAALGSDMDAALICLADMPFVSAKLIDSILAAFTLSAAAVVPTFKGLWGNPVLIHRRLWPEIAGLSGDQGARKLLQAREDTLTFVETDSEILFMDIDTPADLAEAERVLAARIND